MFLTAGNITSPLLNEGLIAIRHLVNKLTGLGKLAGMTAFFLRCLLVAPAQIIKNGTGEQYVLLEYHRYLISKGLDIILPDISSAYTHGTIQYVVKSRNQLYQRRLGASGSTDNADGLSRMNLEIDISKDTFLLPLFLRLIFAVSKIYMVKFNRTILYLIYRVFRIVKSTLLIQHFCNTLCRRTCHGDHDKYHGHHHQTHKNLHGISKETHKFSSGHGAIHYNHFCTNPGNQKNTGIYRQLHDRLVHNDQFFCMDT